MSLPKTIESVELKQDDDSKHWGDGGLVIEFSDWPGGHGRPRLVHTQFCDSVYIRWHPDAHGVSNDPYIEIIGVLDDHAFTIKKMYELDVKGAIAWVYDQTF